MAILPIPAYLDKNSRLRKFWQKWQGSEKTRFSRANCIKAKCLECTYGQIEEIRFCTGKTCPLWGIRPYKTAGENRVFKDTLENKFQGEGICSEQENISE